MINPKAPSTYSLEPSLKLVMKAGKPEHYLAGLSHRIITISIPPLLCAQQRSVLGVGGRVGRMGKTEGEWKVVFMSKKRRLCFQILAPWASSQRRASMATRRSQREKILMAKCFSDNCKLVCLDNDRRQRERRETKEQRGINGSTWASVSHNTTENLIFSICHLSFIINLISCRQIHKNILEQLFSFYYMYFSVFMHGSMSSCVCLCVSVSVLPESHNTGHGD